jgi:N6-L-threonylcarbamoyladenine synthase
LRLHYYKDVPLPQHFAPSETVSPARLAMGTDLGTGKVTRAGSGLILGIESSCDETAAAIVQHGQHTLSNVVASQIATHARYGGVVPELASREHLRNIVPVVRAAFGQAGVTFKDIEAIAVTEGPGLAGALLVGITYAKALSFALGKPLIAVNHLEGHIHAVLLEQAELALAHPGEDGLDGGWLGEAEAGAAAGPVLALVVSGGHTHLYLARELAPGGATAWRYENVGRTVDDAAGEAFDKVAKLLGLGYPGGPWIDALAPHGDARAVPFSFSLIKAKAHRPGERAAMPRFLFSFSGIKTAVLRYVELHHMKPGIEARRRALAAIPNPTTLDTLDLCDAETLNLIASFQRAVVGDLMRKTFLAAETLGAHAVLVSGGVAANRELRVRFTAEAAERNLPIAFPSMALSTDNAAMIAAAAWPKLLAEDFAPVELSAEPNLRLGS